jgi:hypothetical protein
MVKENLNGNQIEHVLVDNGTYDGEIVAVSDIYEAKDLNGNETEKLRFSIRIGDGEILPHFMTAIVSNAGERNQKYRNSKLYDLLSSAGVLDIYNDERDSMLNESFPPAQQNRLFISFLRKVLVGRSVQIVTKTVTSATGEQYSVVDQTLDFIDTSIKEETIETNAAKA